MSGVRRRRVYRSDISASNRNQIKMSQYNSQEIGFEIIINILYEFNSIILSFIECK